MKKTVLILLLAALLLAGCAPAADMDETVPTVTEPVFDTTGQPTIQPTVLYNKNSITVTAHEFGKLGDDYAVSIILTNDSDQNVGVGTRSLSVNGCMMSVSRLECTANSGEKASGYLILDSIELLSAGIETVANMEFYLQFFALGEDDLYKSEMILLETSAAEQTVQPADDSGIEVYNEGGIRIVYQGFTVDGSDNGYANFYLENNTDLTLTFTSDSAKVNGAPQDSYLWTDVRPGTAAIGAVEFYDIATRGITGDEEVATLNVTFYMTNLDTAETYAVTPDLYLSFS